MECIYNQDEFCVNDSCPMCGDYCPVPDIEGVCLHEDREEEAYTLLPKGCFAEALLNNDIHLTDDVMDAVWDDFTEVMSKLGYIEEV